jgi:hypothetical protein
VRVVADPVRAIGLLRQQLDQLDELTNGDDAALQRFRKRTAAVLRNVLPPDHRSIAEFDGVQWTPGYMLGTWEYSENVVQAWEQGRNDAAAILESLLFELEEFGGDTSGSVHLTVPEMKQIEIVLHLYREADDAGELDSLPPDDKAELDAEMATIAAQHRSPKPKRAIVRESLRTARAILENVAASAVYKVIEVLAAGV